jgi:FKBP-type peptidyl-prolyl cis-trans isomerase SlyD
MKIEKDRVVSIHYTLTNDAGETLDSSVGRDPLTYLHGSNSMIPGLERELVGHGAGDEMNVVVQPKDAYGVTNPDLVQEVPLEALAQVEGLEVGMQLQGRSATGETQNLIVDSIGEESATLNANHPLADAVLNFDVKIESVREATAEELEHGHAH